ncbi:MAG: hypothetical protein HY671_10520 [Chloroflexi bacterium]|nr:hypothetical protein [Chloroflexota bacterium]
MGRSRTYGTPAWRSLIKVINDRTPRVIDKGRSDIDHYQIRLAKRIESDGTIVTFPVLGKVAPQGQKTLKGYHSLDEALNIAQEMNPDLPAEVKGLVIVQFNYRGAHLIPKVRKVKPHDRGRPREPDTTEWVRLISREGIVFSIVPGTHRMVAT